MVNDFFWLIHQSFIIWFYYLNVFTHVYSVINHVATYQYWETLISLFLWHLQYLQIWGVKWFNFCDSFVYILGFIYLFWERQAPLNGRQGGGGGSSGELWLCRNWSVVGGLGQVWWSTISSYLSFWSLILSLWLLSPTKFRQSFA